MDIKSLKDKILQLAIQGKLVPQNENDEPASSLLEIIKSEKDKLIKDKTIKKEKPLSEITEQEKVFELPNGWEWTKIGAISKKIHYGYTASAEDNNTGVKLLRITDIQDNRVNWDTVPFCTIDKSKLESCKLFNDDLLIARTGGTIGKSFIVKDIQCDAVFASYLIRIQLLNNINPQYIKIFLESQFYWKQLQEKSQGTGQPNVNTVSLSNLVVPLPSLKEQQRIVAKIDELFKLVEKLDNDKKDLLDNIANSRNKVLQVAIQGKLVEQCEYDEPASLLLEKIKEEKEQLVKNKVIKKEKLLAEITEEEELFKIPKTWEWNRLGNVANIVMGQSPDSSSVSENIGGVEFHQGKASFGKILIKNSELYCTKPTKLAIADDVLLSVRAPVGTLNITDRELCIGRGLTAIRRYIDIENKFFYYFIMALEEELVKKATGTTFKAVASTAIKEFLIPIPPLEEQKRIVAKIDLIMDYLDKLQQEIESQEIILEDILQ